MRIQLVEQGQPFHIPDTSRVFGAAACEPLAVGREADESNLVFRVVGDRVRVREVAVWAGIAASTGVARSLTKTPWVQSAGCIVAEEC
jgi:hypothetical protein